MADTTVTTAVAPSSDATVSSTATAPASETASTTTTATPPSSGESSTAPLSGKGLSYEEVDKRFTEQLAKDAATVAEKKTDTPSETADEPKTADQAEEAKPGEEVKAETKDETPKEEGDEAKVSPKVRAALKAIPDTMLSKEMKKELAENYYIAEAYKKSGMHIGDIHRYLEYGTLEDLEGMRQRTELLQNISSDFESGDTSSLDRLNGVLRTHNPQAYSAWLTRAAGDLEQHAPEAFQKVALQAAHNLLDHLREDAQVEKNEDYDVLAEALEQYLGLTAEGKRQQPPAQSRLTADEERALREANEIRAREQQRVVTEQQALHEGFLTQGFEQTRDNVLKAISTEVERLAEGHTPKAKQRLVRDVSGYVYQTLMKHPTAHETIDSMVRRSGYTQENFNAIVDYATRLAMGFVPFGMERAFQELSEELGPQVRARAEKVERQLARKEIGSGGAVPPPSAPRLSGKGKSLEDVDKEFDRLYMNR